MTDEKWFFLTPQSTQVEYWRDEELEDGDKPILDFVESIKHPTKIMFTAFVVRPTFNTRTKQFTHDGKIGLWRSGATIKVAKKKSNTMREVMGTILMRLWTTRRTLPSSKARASRTSGSTCATKRRRGAYFKRTMHLPTRRRALGCSAHSGSQEQLPRRVTGETIFPILAPPCLASMALLVARRRWAT